MAKTVIVTGSSRGIGEALVRAYRARNWTVVGNSRSTSDPAVDDPGIVHVAGNVADPETASRLVKAAVERFGRLDTLVNNAGLFLAKPFAAYSRDDFANYVDVNLGGFFHMTQSAIGQMLRQGEGGHVVSITTSLVDQPIAGVPSVLASLTKGGIDAATRSLAIEYAKEGIRVNAVSPGIIKTSMHAPETYPAYSALHPMGRMGTAEEIAEAVLYLETAQFVTGETLRVDGGQHAGHW
jgi:NAD(P)-dependent dehydrogenase (short-subunit alcohol dehydrogenase family)